MSSRHSIEDESTNIDDSITINFTFPLLGAHVSSEKTLYETLTRCVQYGMYACQFFLGSPQSFIRKTVEEDDIQKCLSLLKKYPTHVFSHAPYVINLAGSSDGNDMSKIDKCIQALEHELDVMSKLGGGVVLHPGVSKDRKKGLENVASSISSICFKPGYKLLLEVMAGQGNSLGSTLEELKEIYENVSDDKKEYIYFCMDTAHLWGKGLYHLDKIEEVERLFSDMDRVLEKRVVLIHLNDSAVECGSCVDRHELIADGKIWNTEASKEALATLMKNAIDRNIPCVLETHGIDMKKFYL